MKVILDFAKWCDKLSTPLPPPPEKGKVINRA